MTDGNERPRRGRALLPFLAVYLVCLCISVVVVVLSTRDHASPGIWIAVVAFFPASILGPVLMMGLYLLGAGFRVPVAALLIVGGLVCHLPYAWLAFRGAFRAKPQTIGPFAIWSVASAIGWFWITKIKL